MRYSDKNKTQFYDYEGYQVYNVGSSAFMDRGYSSYISVYSSSYTMIYPIDKEKLDSNGVFCPEIQDHPELLDSAKKVYVHPTCTLPREALAKKYKRCLDPLTADAVIIPEGRKIVSTWENAAVFVNKEYETIYISPLSNTAWDTQRERDAFNKVSQAEGGTSFIDLVPPISRVESLKERPSLCGAKLFYFGPVCLFEKKEMHLFDIETFKIPKDKIVYQRTIMNTINDATNEPTFEAMVSIYEMLNSSEDATNDLGLKSLAALDYTNFPQAVRTILSRTGNWCYAKARSSTAVKYMLTSLDINPHRYIGYTDRYISEKDYALTEKLIKYIEKFNSEMDYINYCYNLPFVFVDGELKAHPRLI